MNRRISETVVVHASAIGVGGAGIGTRTVSLDLDAMDNTDIGKALAKGYREAAKDAVADFAPKLTAAWAQQADRMATGDGQGVDPAESSGG